MQIPKELHQTIFSKLPTFMLVRLRGTIITHERFVNMLRNRAERLTIRVSQSMTTLINKYVYRVMFDVEPEDAGRLLRYARLCPRDQFRETFIACIYGKMDYSEDYTIFGIKYALKKFYKDKYRFHRIMFDFGIETSKSDDLLLTMFSEDFLAVVVSLMEKQITARLDLYRDDKCCDGYTFYFYDTKGKKQKFSFDIDRQTNKVIEKDVPTFTKLLQYVQE